MIPESNAVVSVSTKVSELTRSHIQNIVCPEPLAPVYDRIVHSEEENENKDQMIPKLIHMAWIRGHTFPDESKGQSRCISLDMIKYVDRWKKHFPSYSFYFHDDVAVNALFDMNQYWSTVFPQLNQFMHSCVQFGSAMRIDIWRILILYKYGGFYSDFDVSPGPLLTESTIKSNDSAFFLSDSWNRPSQWLMGIEPNHPILFHTMMRIFQNLSKLKDVSKVKLVFLTGPDALKHGYSMAISTGDGGEEPYQQVLTPGVHKTRPTIYSSEQKIVRKLVMKNYLYTNIFDLVPLHRNDTTTTTERNDGDESEVVMVKQRERINKEMKTQHWSDQIFRNRKNATHGACMDLLYKYTMETNSKNHNQ